MNRGNIIVFVIATLAGIAARIAREYADERMWPWILNWAPSFCFSLGVTVLVAGILRRLGSSKALYWRVVVAGVVGALAYELQQFARPERTFDWFDVAGLLAGAGVALILDARFH